MKFLVVIPLYNKADSIARALQSVIDQDYQNRDVLIIDDGSTDSSYDVVNSIKNENITIIQQSNHGVSYTRNLGIKKAIELDYDQVAFLDGDDYWMPNHLNELVHSISRFPNAHIYANKYKLKISATKFSKTKFSNWKSDEAKALKPFFEYNYLNSILSSSSFCMSLKNGEPIYYNEKLTHTEDIDFIIRAGIEKMIVFNPKPTVIIDQTASNRSNAVQLSQRTITDFDSYEEDEVTSIGLRKFLDINRFAIAIGYRLEDDIKNATRYQHKIDVTNLTTKQRNLLEMSRRQLKALKRTQRILGNLGFRLRTGH